MVHLVRTTPEGALDLAHTTTLPSDKATWATGDGGYRVFTEGPNALLISTDGHLVLHDLLTQAQDEDRDLVWLSEQVHERDAYAQLRMHQP